MSMKTQKSEWWGRFYVVYYWGGDRMVIDCCGSPRGRAAL